MNSWKDAQGWEQKWWNNCSNTFGEEFKQLLYASRMGLIFTPNNSTPFRIDMQGKSVLDIGGGPISLLLKCVNVRGKVIDSLEFPQWVIERYKSAGIEFERIKAESMSETGWDEAWIYNVLQHVESPEKVITNTRQAAKIIRISEWIGTSVNIGHPQILTEEKLNNSLRGEGKVEMFTGQNGCKGKGYYGVFKGKKYGR